MLNEIKFPDNGYNIAVVRKEDILNTIDDNIIDKEIAYDIIKQLELDVANFLRQDRWTGIPYIGNIRIPEERRLLMKQFKDGIIDNAKENLDQDKYVIFRKQIAIDNKKFAAHVRHYKYITSIAVRENTKKYKKLAKERGQLYAKLQIYFNYNTTAVDYEYYMFDEEEDNTVNQ